MFYLINMDRFFLFPFLLFLLSISIKFNNLNCFPISTTNSSLTNDSIISNLSSIDYNDDYFANDMIIVDDDNLTSLSSSVNGSNNGRNNNRQISSSYYNRNSYPLAPATSSSISYRPVRCYHNNCLNDGQCIVNPNTMKSYCR